MAVLFPLPSDLEELHTVTIGYAVDVQRIAAKKQENSPVSPVSHAALAALHLRAIVIHRAVRGLCEAGWTPVCPNLIRSLLDVIASCACIMIKAADAEYMGFKYLGSNLLQMIGDLDASEELVKLNQQQLTRLKSHLTSNDLARADQFISNYKPQIYWYKPEYDSPSEILKTASTDLRSMYRLLSSPVHGGFIGIELFNDNPGNLDVNPHEHPVKTRLAIAGSSRILLEISFMRDQCEGTGLSDIYTGIMRDLYMPQKAKATGPFSPIVPKTLQDPNP